MKKNLVLVLGLVILLYPINSCDPEDELNTMKNSDSPTNTSNKNLIVPDDQTYDSDQIEAMSCDEIETTTLYAGKSIDVGLVHISNSADKLFVTFDLTHTQWSLKESHLYVGSEKDIPYTNSGNPKIGQFPYRSEPNDTTHKEFTYAIPVKDLEECFVLIAHAVVEKDDNSGQTETAFGFDQENIFPGGRWGWFMDYCQQECDDIVEIGDQADPESDNGQNDYGSTEDCLESYAYHFSNQSDANCFLTEGFEQWGWTNQVFYTPQMNYVTGYVLNFPLLASAYQCDIRNSLEVGYVEVRITGGDGRFTANIDVMVTDSTYDLRAVDLYIGQEKFPLDGSSNQTVLPEFYNYRESLTETRRLTLSNLPWPSNAHFIARGLLCPVN
jgi:hypothetical protein